jgi:23S rRNA G2069 N7-methylase RlmK/C1962 C5-methylase RlmI
MKAFILITLLALMFAPICRPFRVIFHIAHTARTAVTTAPVARSTSSITATAALPTAVVVLEKGKARLFQDGNPLVYGGAVKDIQGDPKAGDEVIVRDHMSNDIGRGTFNPYSTYRVRMLVRNYEDLYRSSLGEILLRRIQEARDMRRSLNLPEGGVNTVYRLINGEGDRLGGLIVDVLGDIIVAQSSALWVELHRKVIADALVEALAIGQPNGPRRLIWRQAESRLKQDGYQGKIDPDETSNSRSSDGGSESVPESEHIVVENGAAFAVDLFGQKTGFYADQRENRLMLRKLARDKTVLDCFCYSAGFSVNAALGGATRVTAVDSSKPALDTARANLKLNNIDHVVDLVKADALDYMNKMIDSKQQYDIVICDPPKLAPTRASLDKARNKYTKINALAMQLVKPGGILLTCTCSAAVTQQEGEFRRMLQEAAKSARRDVTLLNESGPGADHATHLSYPEGAYLTAYLLRVL